MLYYLPLEPYRERYTWYMSCSGGWAETWFKQFRVPFRRVDGDKVGTSISVGSVLDGYGRSIYAMSQVTRLLELIREGEVQDGDVVYTEDFWHPGMEAVFYVRNLTGLDFKVGCFMYAQSIDNTDFTYPMRSWMRPMEVGLSRGYDFVFICSPLLKQLAVAAGYEHLHKHGLPYNSGRLLEQLQNEGFTEQAKEPFVLFSSRFDTEKNPHFFLDLVERCPDVLFKLVKPRVRVSNNVEVEQRLAQVLTSCNNFELVDTSEKMVYYGLLSRAKVQFNCALQDWVSWTLLEAITFGCNPLYPAWKDFPVELEGFERDHIYENRSLPDAEAKLRRLLSKSFDSRMQSIVERHDRSWQGMLKTMGLTE